MKKLINLLLAFVLVFAFSCKSREKQVQKSENQTETKSEASAKIEEKTFEIIQDKELSIFDKSNFTQNSETQKEQTKDIQVIREYYENGNLKSEIQKSFSQLSEATKYAIAEMREELTKETENSKYWEKSSNHYYQLLEEEKSKTKSYQMQLKAVPKNNWHWWLLIGFLAGFSLPFVWRKFKSWLLRFNPYLKLVEKVKKVIG